MQLAEVSPGSAGIGGIWQLQRGQVVTIRLQNSGLPKFQLTGVSCRSHSPRMFLEEFIPSQTLQKHAGVGVPAWFLMHFSIILTALLVSHMGILAAVYNVQR